MLKLDAAVAFAGECRRMEESALEPYKPSMDWGHELIPSLLWILKAWAIAAVLTMIVLVLLARFTSWGRQYWRVTGGRISPGAPRSGSGSGWLCCCSR